MSSFAAKMARWTVLPAVKSRLSSLLWTAPAPLPQLQELRRLSASFVARSPQHAAARRTLVRDLSAPDNSGIRGELHSAAGRSVADHRRRPRVIALHGGAFVCGDAALYRPVWSALAEAADADVYAVSTKLAPENSIEAIHAHAEAAYRWAVQDGAGCEPNQDVVLVGDSAGAHIAVSLLLRLHAQGAAGLRPRAVILSSPVLSFAKQFSDAAALVDDPLLPFDRNALQALGSFVASGQNVLHAACALPPAERAAVLARLESDVALSPLAAGAAALSGGGAMPTTVHVSVGELEGLAPQVHAFASLLRGDVRVSKRDGLWHSFPVLAGHIREADDELRLWADVIRSGSRQR